MPLSNHYYQEETVLMVQPASHLRGSPLYAISFCAIISVVVISLTLVQYCFILLATLVSSYLLRVTAGTEIKVPSAENPMLLTASL